MRTLGMLLALAGIVVRAVGAVDAVDAVAAESEGNIVYTCRFDGPYDQAGRDDMLQRGWTNNYEWGVKDIRLSADAGVTGQAQRIEIRGISSGEWQFFSPAFPVKRGFYYRIRFKARAEGLEGKLSVQIRKRGGPWTTFVPARQFTPTGQWAEYEAGGVASTDADRDLGILFSTGAPGRVWLDDIVVEELPEPPATSLPPDRPLISGNLIPRSSFEGERDWLWTNGIHSDPYGEWEDPQARRAEGGKFGRHCLALPLPRTPESRVFLYSYRLPVAAGHPYQYSIWLRASAPGTDIQLCVLNKANKGLALKGFRLGTEWRRYTLPVPPIAKGTTDVYAGLIAFSGEGAVFADGAQLEAGDAPTDYAPKYPLELYAVMRADGCNLLEWDEAAAVRLLAAAARDDAPATCRVRLRLVAFPDREVWTRTMDLATDEETPLDLAPGRRGLFRLEIVPPDAAHAAPQEMLFALLPPPRPTGADSLFGTHFTVRPFFLEYARGLVNTSTRSHDASGITKWWFGEPEPGRHQYADEQVDALKASGFHLLGLPDAPPAWAKRPAGQDGNVIDMEAFSAYCSRLARHYRGRIDHWEMWNEPYMEYFFAGTPEQYGEILRTGSAVIRRENPDAKILGFCTEVTDLAYARRIPAGDRSVIDILSFHCYFQNLVGGGTTQLSQEVAAYRKFLEPRVPVEIWNSEGANHELGANCFYSFLADDDINNRAAAFGARVWTEHLKAGIDRFFMYTLHQSDTIMYAGGYKALIGFDRSVTPVAVSTAVAAWAVDGLRSQPTEAVDGVVQGYFTGPDRQAYVVFNDSGHPGRRTFAAGSLPVTWKIVDVMGNDPRRDGQDTVVLGIHPYFIVQEGEKAEDFLSRCRESIRSGE